MLEKRYLGEIDRLRASLDLDGNADVRDALAAVARAAEELLPLRTGARVGAVECPASFFAAACERCDDERAGAAAPALVEILGAGRGARARTAIRCATIDDLAPDIRRWIEEETFVPESSGRRLHLLDAQAARFGDFDDVTLVGLIEGEWPERPRRNIFYAPSVLGALGWPSETRSPRRGRPRLSGSGRFAVASRGPFDLHVRRRGAGGAVDVDRGGRRARR